MLVATPPAEYIHAAFKQDHTDILVFTPGQQPQMGLQLDDLVPVDHGSLHELTSGEALTAEQIREFAEQLAVDLEDGDFADALQNNRPFSGRFRFPDRSQRDEIYLRVTVEPQEDGLKATIQRVDGSRDWKSCC